MKCKNCGKELAENAVICTECGQAQEVKSVRPFLCKLFKLISFSSLALGVLFMVIAIVTGGYVTALDEEVGALLMLRPDLVGATLGIVFTTLAFILSVVGFIFGMTEKKKILDKIEDWKPLIISFIAWFISMILTACI